jgi:hypothetical protein
MRSDALTLVTFHTLADHVVCATGHPQNGGVDHGQ